MALTVETGAGLANAESFVSVSNADARATALGNAAWLALATTALKEEALRRATVYMEQAYRSRWKGQRVVSMQALSWPRYDVCVDGFSVESNIVPTDIANACADLAFKAATAELAPDLERGVVREKVGPIETEYDAYSPQQTRFRAIDLMLAPYLSGGSGMARIERA